MIKNVNLYQVSSGRIDKAEFTRLKEVKGSALTAQIPFTTDIGIRYLIVHFKGNDYSFARTYTYEKAYPATKNKDEKQEIIESRCYKLTFNNPHDSEKPITRFIILSKGQNFLFFFVRVINWFSSKDNSLWLVNIIVLILNIIAFIFHKS